MTLTTHIMLNTFPSLFLSSTSSTLFHSPFLSAIRLCGYACKTRLVVDGLAVGGHGSLLEGLGEGWVSMRGAGNILGAGTVLESEDTLCNHLTGVGADNVDTEDTVSLGISEELDHAVRVEVGLCARVGAEGERADLVLDALLLELLLVLANPCNLGVSVHDRGDGVVVDVAVASLDELNGCNGLFLGLVCKHRAKGAVTNDADVGDLGAVLLVNDKTAAVVGFKANVLKAKAGSVWATANGDENDIGVKL